LPPLVNEIKYEAVRMAQASPGKRLDPLLGLFLDEVTWSPRAAEQVDAWWDKQPPRRTPQQKTAACRSEVPRAPGGA
jgi:hypothetical protein